MTSLVILHSVWRYSQSKKILLLCLCHIMAGIRFLKLYIHYSKYYAAIYPNARYAFLLYEAKNMFTLLKISLFSIRRHQIFSGGSSDENGKVLGKFLAHLRRAKKGGSKFFACSGFFFIVEALKTVKNQ